MVAARRRATSARSRRVGERASPPRYRARDARMRRTDGPLLVFGPRSLDYDFGPSHPLTPLRFGPGIDLLRAVGAEPGLAPEPATDEDLLLAHLPAYLEAVKALLPRSVGAAVDGDRLVGQPGVRGDARGVRRGRRRLACARWRRSCAGTSQHAHHPGGGLHHAMPSSASGFCVYDDPALAIVRARADGLRVLYVDLDVHHGDGVQAICSADPGAMTVSFHESGRYLFPGTGSIRRAGGRGGRRDVRQPAVRAVRRRRRVAGGGPLAGAVARRRVRAGRRRVAARRGRRTRGIRSRTCG